MTAETASRTAKRNQRGFPRAPQDASGTPLGAKGIQHGATMEDKWRWDFQGPGLPGFRISGIPRNLSYFEDFLSRIYGISGCPRFPGFPGFPNFLDFQNFHAPRGLHGSPKGTHTDKKDPQRPPKKFRMTSESDPTDPQSLPKDPGFQKRPQRAPKDPKGIPKGPQQLHRPGHLINKSVSLQKGRAQNQSTRN